MSPQETQALQAFLAQLQQAQAGQKDAQAHSMIAEACAKQPDATYLLVQRALLLEQALNQAQSQVTRLQGELEQTRKAGNGFLDTNSGWGNSQRNFAPAAPVQQFAQFGQAAPASNGFFSGSGSSWLGTAAATAAGVAAGAFLFQGLGNMFNSHSAPSQAAQLNAGDSSLDAGYFDRPENQVEPDASSSLEDFSADDSSEA